MCRLAVHLRLPNSRCREGVSRYASTVTGLKRVRTPFDTTNPKVVVRPVNRRGSTGRHRRATDHIQLHGALPFPSDVERALDSSSFLER
jgi:hypothetical protein